MLKNILKYTLFVGIAVGFTYLSLRSLTKESSLEDLWQRILDANYYWVFLSMIMGYAAIASRGLRWKLLLEPLGYNPSSWNSIHAVAVAYFSNLAVPRSGEIARCTSLYSTDNIPVDKLIGTVISERVIDVLFLLVFMFLAISLNADAFKTFIENADFSAITDKTWLMGLLGGLFLLFIILIFVFRKRIMQLNFAQKILNFLMGIKEGVFTIGKMKRKWAFLGHTIFIWSMYAGMAIVVFQAMPETKDIPVHQGLFIMVAGGLAMILPSPGGAGTYPYAVGLAFVALGMTSQVGGTFGWLVWIAQTAMMIIGGIIGVLMVVRARDRNKALREEKNPV